IKAHYTVLWFWDPDCDHCQEMTPILHQMYQEHSEEWDFEVFAVEVNNDHDRWVAFSDKNELWDWTNLSTSMGDANLDFIEYFDIMTTPVVILVNNNDHHTIIARQIPLNELSDFFSSQTHD
ncbi:MAG: thioredoxin family protein, partial [Bacteroidales bacterium]|nr:thioredoxin family protein [Bacteroidales bacterium]